MSQAKALATLLVMLMLVIDLVIVIHLIRTTSKARRAGVTPRDKAWLKAAIGARTYYGIHIFFIAQACFVAFYKLMK